jgi:isopentenyl phosphate kinase
LQNLTNLTILKLGGSVITKKNEPFVYASKTIRRLAREIAKADIKSLIIVHGGGSFGHPIAKEYSIKQGYKDPSQLYGLAKTHLSMLRLNHIVMTALMEEDVPAFPIQPSSCFVTKGGRIDWLNIDAILDIQRLGLVPVLYGDVSFDQKIGFTILSGDQIVSYLSIRLGATRIVMGIDVDGLYVSNPKTDPSSRLLHRVDLSKQRNGIKNLDVRSDIVDVTGGMGGKLQELIPALRNGAEAILVNALRPKRVLKALRGEAVIGTVLL